MARERTAAPMSGFFKFTRIGQSVAGHVNKYKVTGSGEDQSTFIIMRPILICADAKREGGPVYERWESAAVGLSTDLKLKISPRDEGAFMRITYTDTEASRKGNPRKVFTVEELEPAEIRALNETAGKDHQMEPYFEKSANADSAATDDEGDDLPF